MNTIEKRTDDNKIVITIDLEEHFNSGKQHPEDDPGVVIYYVIKVDDKRHEVKRRHMLGKDILSLDGKNPEFFNLEQSKRINDQMHLVEILPDETVDFGTHGIEKFFTKAKSKVYDFWIGQKEYKTTESSLTVRQILENFAKVDPITKTLARKTEGGFIEYKNLDEVISMDNCPHFSLFDNTSLPVS